MFEEGFPLASHRWLVRAALVAALGMVIAGSGSRVWYLNAAEEETTLVAAGALAQMAAVVIAGALLIWRRGYLVHGALPVVALLAAGTALVMTVGEWVTAYRFGVESDVSAFSYALAAMALAQTVICAAIMLRPREELTESNTDWPASRLPGR